MISNGKKFRDSPAFPLRTENRFRKVCFSFACKSREFLHSERKSYLHWSEIKLNSVVEKLFIEILYFIGDGKFRLKKELKKKNLQNPIRARIRSEIFHEVVFVMK